MTAPWRFRRLGHASLAAAAACTTARARPVALRPPAHLRRPQFRSLARLAGDSRSGWSSRTEQRQWVRLVDALPRYVEEHGHGWVPPGYVTADGYAMGADAAKARRSDQRERLGIADQAALTDAEFEWDYKEYRWGRAATALQTYLDLNEHLRVPKSFAVPEEAPWPESCWGMKLGGTVSNIRSSEQFVKDRPERRQLLDDMGFVWDDFEHRWAEEVLPALHTYLDLNGHLSVPQSFAVPEEAPWPESCWGMKLGETVGSIRSREQFVKDRPERRQLLDDMGFVWDDFEHRWAEVALPALHTYLDLNGHLRVPISFVVPEEAPWPESCWGMKLGGKVQNIRSEEGFVKDRPERRQLLDDMGFVWDEFEHRWAEVVLPALHTYLDLNGHLRVPRSFVVPEEAPWPESCWGMRLGETVGSIRSSEQFVKDRPERRQLLDDMGFVWDDFEHRWAEVALPALHTYLDLNGHLRVPISFVVPEEAPWPESCWGMKLGSTVSDIRSSRERFVKDRPVRRELLDSMGFVWRARGVEEH